jgi:hypothetical protein
MGWPSEPAFDFRRKSTRAIWLKGCPVFCRGKTSDPIFTAAISRRTSTARGDKGTRNGSLRWWPSLRCSTGTDEITPMDFGIVPSLGTTYPLAIYAISVSHITTVSAAFAGPCLKAVFEICLTQSWFTGYLGPDATGMQSP